LIAVYDVGVDQPDLLSRQRSVILGLLWALAAAAWAVLAWPRLDPTLDMTASAAIGPQAPLFLVM
jgi:predicted metal-binding membrane protein